MDIVNHHSKLNSQALRIKELEEKLKNKTKKVTELQDALHKQKALTNRANLYHQVYITKLVNKLIKLNRLTNTQISLLTKLPIQKIKELKNA